MLISCQSWKIYFDVLWGAGSTCRGPLIRICSITGTWSLCQCQHAFSSYFTDLCLCFKSTCDHTASIMSSGSSKSAAVEVVARAQVLPSHVERFCPRNQYLTSFIPITEPHPPVRQLKFLFTTFQWRAMERLPEHGNHLYWRRASNQKISLDTKIRKRGGGLACKSRWWPRVWTSLCTPLPVIIVLFVHYRAHSLDHVEDGQEACTFSERSFICALLYNELGCKYGVCWTSVSRLLIK